MNLFEFIKKNIIILIAILIIIGILIFYSVREYRASKTIYQSKENEEYVMIPKTYGVNEYTTFNISLDTMLKIYFNDYKSIVINDMNEAYNKIDEEYRKIKFPTIESFREYLVKTNFINFKIDKYSTNEPIYTLYDEKGNMFIFKVEGVLQYKVYFDTETVEIR